MLSPRPSHALGAYVRITERSHPWPAPRSRGIMDSMTRENKREPLRRVWNEDGTLQLKECRGPLHEPAGAMLPADAFPINSSSKDGRFARCRDCAARTSRRRRAAIKHAIESGERPPAHWEIRKVDDLYFVQCGCPAGEVKIGRGDPVERMKDARGITAHELTLLARVRDEGHSKRRWHDRFHHLRVRGEWFTPAPELLGAIREASSGNL